MSQTLSGPAALIDAAFVPASSGLNLWLELSDPTRTRALLQQLQRERPAIDAALNHLNYVHFARFLPTPDLRVLQVITSFDGELDAYVLDFVLAIGDQFEMIMSHVKDRPPSPIKDHPAEFLQFIRKHDLGYGQVGGGGIRLYSAYPERTVIDIRGPAWMAPAAVAPTPVLVDRADVQANILHGSRWRHGWHVGLHFDDPGQARALLGELHDGSHGAPRLSSDAPWAEGRPPYTLNLGLTYAGLLALGIGEKDCTAFKFAHHPFFRGPAERAAATAHGDTGASQPALWELGGAYPIDMLVSVYADDEAELQQLIEALLARCAAHRLSVVNHPWPVQSLRHDEHPDRQVVHFGYVDGLAQPRLAIVGEPPGRPDLQPLAGVGEFLLGKDYPNVFGGRNSLGGLSEDLAQNASFAAVRIMEQDVAGFEALLDAASAKHGVDREWLAAKLMGRWRDGTPLTQSPDRPLPDIDKQTRNQFDYAPSVDAPCTPDDSTGLRCPVGAHARRMNPRSARVAGRPHSRRMLRRGMPYGPWYEAGSADQARGLVGLFLCADLDRQFEFVLRQWAQGDRATSGLVGQQDPLIGAQENPAASYRIPMPEGRDDIVLRMPRLVKTVGSVYLFMPGLGGVRHLAGLRPASRPAPAAAYDDAHAPAPQTIDPLSFDPRAKRFRDAPFDAYAWFRAHRPVAELPTMASTWIFSHRHVAMVAADQQRFRKRRSTDPSPAGLLNMDPPPHTQCRAAIERLFNEVLDSMAPGVESMVQKLYASRCSGKGRVDLLAEFARPVAHAAFFELFGLNVAQASGLIAQVELILAMATPAGDADIKMQLKKEQQALANQLFVRFAGLRKPGRLFDRILQMTTLHDPVSNQAKGLATALQVEQLTNAATLAMAGFLPLQWFIALAAWRLLEHEGRLLLQLQADPAISNRDVVAELLRFDMSTPLSDRYVAADTELDGMPLAADQRLTLAWASANRDEGEFGPDADTIDVTRGKGHGWAFGDAGEHNCLGRTLVYLVMEPVIEVLRTAKPAPRLAAGFVPAWGTPSDGAMFRAMAVLMVDS